MIDHRTTQYIHERYYLKRRPTLDCNKSDQRSSGFERIGVVANALGGTDPERVGRPVPPLQRPPARAEHCPGPCGDRRSRVSGAPRQLAWVRLARVYDPLRDSTNSNFRRDPPDGVPEWRRGDQRAHGRPVVPAPGVRRRGGLERAVPAERPASTTRSPSTRPGEITNCGRAEDDTTLSSLPQRGQPIISGRSTIFIPVAGDGDRTMVTPNGGAGPT